MSVKKKIHIISILLPREQTYQDMKELKWTLKWHFTNVLATIFKMIYQEENWFQ